MSGTVLSRSLINSGIAMAGLYCLSHGTTYGASFLRVGSAKKPDPDPDSDPFPFFKPPPGFSVSCLSAGLILFRSLEHPNLFCIINPDSGKYMMLPPPEIPIPSNWPAALVCYRADDRYICDTIFAISHPSFEGCYGFCSFSTLTGKWSAHFPLPQRIRDIIPNSSISCGTTAYFRTERELIEMQRDGDGYKIQIWRLPQLCLQPGTCMQLGCIGGKLHLVAVIGTYLLLYQWSPEKERPWRVSPHEVGSIVTEGSLSLSGAVIKPLRFESEMQEFPLLVDGRPVVLELLCNSAKQDRLRAWAVPFGGRQAPEPAEDCVPFLKRCDVFVTGMV